MLFLLFFLSGAAGLMFEIVWVRQFGNIFGNTVYSAALVSAVFMFGLGAGGLAAGFLSDKLAAKFRPVLLLLGYALCEMLIATLGLGYAWLLPHFEALSPLFSWYSQTAEGWFELALVPHMIRYLFAAALLMPITLLMGATLTLLIRHLLADSIKKAGWQIGLLYGVNTAGAAVGCFAVDFFLIPTFGLLGTQAVAAACNVLAGAGAALLYLRSRSAQSAPLPAPVAVEAAAASTRQDFPERNRLFVVGGAVLLAGFAGLGVEILWFRFISSYLGNLRSIFSLMLTVILVGIWLGSHIGGWLSRKFSNPTLLFGICQALFGVAVIASIQFFDPGSELHGFDAARFAESSSFVQSSVELLIMLRVVLVVIGIPALLMGVTYPLANAIVQTSVAAVGTRAGLLYLCNTFGAVFGSLLVGFILVPTIGMKDSVTVLAVASLGAVTLLYLHSSNTRRAGGEASTNPRWPWALAAGALAACIAGWGVHPWDYMLQKVYGLRIPLDNQLVLSEGINESIAIDEQPDPLDPGTPYRTLYVNGSLMSTTQYNAERYMRSFVHIPLLHLDAPKKTLVICFGVGNTLHAASLYPSIEDLQIVDLSRQIVKNGDYFAPWNHDVLKDPRVHVYINDGRQHLRMQPEGTYDLITLEPPPISTAGVAALYSREFYGLASRALKDGGFLTQWLPAYQLEGPLVLSMIRAFTDVFPESMLLSGYGQHLILMGRKNAPIRITPADWQRRLDANPKVKTDLEKYSLATLRDFIGTFAGSAATLAVATKDAEPVTDDYPIIEYSRESRLFRRTEIPSSIFATDQASNWCPECFVDPALGDMTRNYLRLFGDWYSSAAFRVDSRREGMPPFDPSASVSPEWFRALSAESYYVRTALSP